MFHLSGVTGGLDGGQWFSVSVGAPCSGVAPSSWHIIGVPSIFVEFNVLRGQGFLYVLFAAVSTEESQQVF